MVGFFQEGAIVQSGRLVGALLYGVNLILFGFAVYKGTRHSLLAMVSAVMFFMCSAPILYVHAMAWSEALFITSTLAAFFLLSLHIKYPSMGLLLAASLGTGLATATRYAGVALLPPMVFVLVAFTDRANKKKMTEVFVFLAIASLPLTYWSLRNIVLAQTVAGRSFAIHPVDLRHLWALIETVHDFILPIYGNLWMKFMIILFGAVFISVAIFWLYRKKDSKSEFRCIHTTLPFLCILFFPAYLCFLGFSISFFDAYIPVDFRILLPAFLMLCIAGFSYAYSFKPDVIHFSVGQKAIMLPVKVVAGTSKANENYHKQVDQISDLCKKGNVLVAYFNWVTWRWYLPTTFGIAFQIGRQLR